MSVSVFYTRFKSVAAVSPLQYQKYIRLHEARSQMIAKHAAEAEVAFAVGYESASQFSREYKRLFGEPLGCDTGKARARVRGKPEKVPPMRGDAPWTVSHSIPRMPPQTGTAGEDADLLPIGIMGRE